MNDLRPGESKPEPSAYNSETSNSVTTRGRPDPTLPGGYGAFFSAIAVLAAIRIAVGFVSLPESAIGLTNLILAALFVAVPVLAEFFGANAPWTWKVALYFLLGGIVVQILFGIAAGDLTGAGAGLANAISQAGLDTWCVGLGALLGTALRDKNLLIPISIFAAAYDIYLVLTPAGITKAFIKAAPKVFTSVAAQVPAVTTHAATGRAAVSTYVGPADLVFLAAFFIVIFRFKMNPRLTLFFMAPVLVIYMLAVLLFDISLPALVPIGTCVLAANWRHFKLSRDEWLATGVVFLLCAGLIGWSMSRRRPEPEQQAAPSQPGVFQAPAGSDWKPAREGPSSRPSVPLSVRGNTPGPQ